MQAANNGAVKTNSFPSTGVSFGGTDPLSQVLTGVALVAIIYFTLLFAEYLYKSYLGMFRDRVELFPDTYPSGSLSYTAVQNPASPIAQTVYTSDNQRSGVEFSYAMFCYIQSSTFRDGNSALYHILHKGYSKAYPLMGPGIFVHGNANTLRVYMNSYSTWNNFCDIENIPVEKWFHLVVSCKGNQLLIYINGNLKTKMALAGNTPPYQNYGDVSLFSSRKFTLNSTTTSSLKNDTDDSALSLMTSPGAGSNLVFAGSASGMVSRVFYFSYALTYTEIQTLMNMGPSPKIAGPSMSISPYLIDQWWTNK
uniref:LamG-like jellyroll fold domain-containing protein n=1 Tax=viral metagenome TaxID=1070528 RepID=A0A6C0LQA5_9ZZZZ